jgi:hypothetical protein
MLASGWVNLLLRAPGLGGALKTAAGFTTERPAPALAAESFQITPMCQLFHVG